MLNVFSLASAINESNNQVYASGYDFVGSMDEASSNMQYMAMMESLDSCHFSIGVEEIIVEAVVNNNGNLDILIEASLKEIWNKIVAFLKRVWDWIKGMIQKIRNYISDAIHKNSGYKKSLAKAVAKAEAKYGKDAMEATAIERYVYNMGMMKPDGSGSLIGGVGKAVNEISNKLYETGDIMGDILDIASSNIEGSMLKPGSGEKEHERSPKAEHMEKIDKEIEELKKLNDNANKAAGEMVAKNIGLSGVAADKMFSVWEERVRGGTKKKIVKLRELGGARKLLDNIDEYNKFLSGSDAAFKEYDTTLKKVNADIKELSNNPINRKYQQERVNTASSQVAMTNSDYSIDTKFESEYAAKVNAACNAAYSLYTSICGSISKYLGNSHTTYRSMVNEMLAADVASLKKACNGDAIETEYDDELNAGQKKFKEYSGKDSSSEFKDKENTEKK